MCEVLGITVGFHTGIYRDYPNHWERIDGKRMNSSFSFDYYQTNGIRHSGSPVHSRGHRHTIVSWCAEENTLGQLVRYEHNTARMRFVCQAF